MRMHLLFGLSSSNVLGFDLCVLVFWEIVSNWDLVLTEEAKMNCTARYLHLNSRFSRSV